MMDSCFSTKNVLKEKSPGTATDYSLWTLPRLCLLWMWVGVTIRDLAMNITAFPLEVNPRVTPALRILPPWKLPRAICGHQE